jgi:beta-galactosidase
MVVWTEIPLINRITRSSAFSNNAQQQLLELIRQNYNHPSILFWGIGNEQRVGLDFFSVNQLLGQLAALVRTEDPYRLSTYADCCATDRSAFTTHTDVIGYNKYFGWYYGSYNDFGNWADKLHAAIPNRAIGVSEFGAGGSVKQHTEYPIVAIPPAPFHPEEYQNLFHEAHWQAMKTRPFLWGNFIWNMFDSASDSRDEGDTPGRNDKGLVTYDRTTKKDAFFWYKANWRNWEDGDGKVVYITSRRFTNRIKPTTTIKVYSNADSVELKVNGVSQGSKTSGDRLFQWTSVPLVIGNNTIEAIGTKNGTTITDTVNWKRRSLLP